MFIGHKRGNRVIFTNVKDSSTLRNKGFIGKNIGEKLSLDLFTAAYLSEKKKIEIHYKGKVLHFDDIIQYLGHNISLFYAYKFLREKGYKPLIKDNRIYVKKIKVKIIEYPEIIDFNLIKGKRNYAVVVDSNGDCILYSLDRFYFKNKKIDRSKNKVDFINRIKDEKYSIKPGTNFGSEYRVYEGDNPHAKYLLNFEDSLNSKDLIARVRVAHSVKKIYLQGYGKSRIKFLSIKWITV